MSTFYKSVPVWVTAIVEKHNCPKCKVQIKKTDINGIGLKEIDGKNTYVIEFACPGCRHNARLTFENHTLATIERLCYLLLNELHNQRRSKVARKMSPITHKKPITDKEVKEFLDKMNSTDSYEEFLKLIKVNISNET